MFFEFVASGLQETMVLHKCFKVSIGERRRIFDPAFWMQVLDPDSSRRISGSSVGSLSFQRDIRVVPGLSKLPEGYQGRPSAP